MSIIFFGTPDFAVPALKALIASGETVSLVVTQPDKVKGRGHKLAAPPVKTAASESGIKISQPLTLKDGSFIKELKDLAPEFIITVAYGKILPKAVLDIPEKGCINIHASLLPKYRGAAPVQWAIINNDKTTGVTTMLMDEGLDTGPILLQRQIPIDNEDTGKTLDRKLSELGASLLIETISGVRNGSVKPRQQQGESSYAPILRKEDGLIDWSKSAEYLSRFIRGMQPWPCAYCYINNEQVKVIMAEPVNGRGIAGVVVKASQGQLLVGTGEGLLSIIELQPAGKKPMPASAFLQGRKLTEGILISHKAHA